jgi:hypothetical protein
MKEFSSGVDLVTDKPGGKLENPTRNLSKNRQSQC